MNETTERRIWLGIGFAFVLSILFFGLAQSVSADVLAYNTTNVVASTASNVPVSGGTSVSMMVQNFTSIGTQVTKIGLNLSNYTGTLASAGTYVNILLLNNASVYYFNGSLLYNATKSLPLLDNSNSGAGGTYVQWDVTSLNWIVNTSQTYSIVFHFMNGTGNINGKQTSADVYSCCSSAVAGGSIATSELLMAIYQTNISTSFPITAKDYYDNQTLNNITVNVTESTNATFSDYNPVDNITAWYKLDSNTQTAPDSSGNGNTGTLNGWTFNNLKYADGVTFNNNVNVTGINNPLSLTSNISNGKTFCFDSQFTGVSGITRNIFRSSSTTASLAVRSTGFWAVYNGTNYAVSTQSVDVSNNNHFICYVYNTSNWLFYYDGVFNSVIPSTYNPTLIDQIAQSGVNGTLARIRVWSVSLNSTQILNENSSVLPYNSNGLILSFLFNSNFTNATGNYTYDTNNLVAGQINGSFTFRGSQYIQTTNSNTTDPFSVSYWYYDYGTGGTLRHLNHRSGNFGWLMQKTGSRWQFVLGNGTATSNLNSVTGSTAYVWSFITAVYNGTHQLIYVNGVLENSVVFANYAPAPSTIMRIGGDGSTNFNGSIFDVRIYNRSLTAEEIQQLYVAVSQRIYKYTTTNGTITTNILTNSTSLWNVSTCSSDNRGYLCKQYTNQNVSTALTSYLYPKYLLLNISAKDYYDNQTLSDIGATFTPALELGQSNFTSTGTLSVWLPINVTHSIALNSNQSGGYFQRSGYSQTLNTTKNNYLNDTLWQSIVGFSAIEKLTNNTITGVQANVTNQSNTSVLYLKAGTYTATLGKSGYFNKQITFTANATTSSALVSSDWYNAKLNITGISAVNGANISTFTATITALNYSNQTEAISTTNGSAVFELLNGTYYVEFDASGYSLVNATILVNGSVTVNNYSFRPYTTNSINISFYDETRRTLLTNVTSTIEFISDAASYSYSTTNGTLYVDLLSPEDYILRYAATGYDERFSYLTVTNRTTQNLTLYLLNSSIATNITVTVLDEKADNVEAALVRVLKYNVTNNEYEEVEAGFTDSSGKFIFAAELGVEFYKFMVEFPVGEVVLITDPAYITSTSIPLQISRISELTNLDKYLGVTTSLEFNNNTYSFRSDYSNSENLLGSVCLYVYRTDLQNRTLYDSECSTDGTQSGTILVSVENITGRVYRADLYLNFDGDLYYARSLTYSFKDVQGLGSIGLIFVAVITLIFVFIFKESVVLSMVVSPLPLIAASAMSMIAVPVYISLGVALVIWVSAYFVSRYQQ